MLTKSEIKWLHEKIQLSIGYSRKIKCDIRRKLKIFNELELPLLVKSGFIPATANCNNVMANCNNISLGNFSNCKKLEICAQNMDSWMGRKGCVTISVLKVDF